MERPQALNTIARVYENLINSRLLEEIQKCGDFHEIQFGFRKGKTSIDAVNLVVENARRAASSGKWNALIQIDTRNAFNTASWVLIIKRLKKKKVKVYMINLIVTSYRPKCSPGSKPHQVSWRWRSAGIGPRAVPVKRTI